MEDSDGLSVEDREVLDALTDPDDVEAFKNIVDNARGQGKTGVQLVREDPANTSRKAIRRLCLKDKLGFLSALFRTAFGHRARRPAASDSMALDSMKPPRR